MSEDKEEEEEEGEVDGWEEPNTAGVITAERLASVVTGSSCWMLGRRRRGGVISGTMS